MSGYVNTFYVVVPISVGEKAPQQIQFLDLLTADSNAIVEMRRFDMSNTADTGIVITGGSSITANIVTVSTIWNTVGDTPVAGNFRVRIQAQNPTGSIIREANLIYTVLA